MTDRQIKVFAVIIALGLMLSAFSGCASGLLDFSSSFSVKMSERSSPENELTVIVELPSSGRESDICFIIDDIAYNVLGAPTTSNSVFELASDGHDRAAALKLSDEMSGEVELQLTDPQGNDRSFHAPMKAFERLLNYLKSN